MSDDLAYLRDLARTAKTPEELAQLEAWAEELLGSQTSEPDAEAGTSEPEGEDAAAQDHIDTVNARQNERTAQSQEIGPLPPVKDPARRAKCKASLRAFTLTYFEPACFMGLSPYQEEMVSAFEDGMVHRRKICRAVRRGGLKSTLARIAAIWAVVNGHCRFPVVLGATDSKGNESRDNILQMIGTSPELIEDYPELIPLVLKDRNPKKQLRLDGELLTVFATDKRGCIVLPNIKGTDCYCARIAPYGILATDVSGLAYVDDDGKTVRPDALLLDDVQTPQSAKSFMMTNSRENTISTTLEGLAGLGQTIAAIMVCTRRETDCLTARYLDRERHPDWDGKKYPVLISEPTNKPLWVTYAQLLRSGDTFEDGLKAATEFYREHREEMDAGAKPSWELDKEDAYLSAVQWALTQKILKPDYYRSELNQDGAAPQEGLTQLEGNKIVTRLSHVPRGIIPAKASYVTAFVDSQDEVLFWMVCAWQKDFSGWIVARGTWPDQKRVQFYKSDLSITISSQLPDRSWEEAFVHAHNQLETQLLRGWQCEDGSMRTLDLLLKDWSDGTHTPRIEAQVMASAHRANIRPSKGFAPKPGKKPLHKYGDDEKDRNTGADWVERRTDMPIHVQYDTNKWKGHASRRLQTTVGAPSSVLLYGDDENEHGLLAEHFTAEVAKSIVYDESPGTVYEELPGRDNDWFDCYVGNNVAASMLGCLLPGEKAREQQEGSYTVVVPPHLLRRRA